MDIKSKNKAQLSALTGEQVEREQKNFNTISSIEVAEMLDKDHCELLREIDGRKDNKNVGIIPTLEKGNFPVSDYFIPSTYQAGNRTYKCYEVTKMGCEVLGNKQQGEKGILFTAKYVKRFNELEQEVMQPRKLSALEQLKLQNEAILEVNEKIDSVDQDLQDFKQDLPLLGCDMDRITTAVKKMGVDCLGGKDTPAYQDNSLRGKVYSDIYDQLKRQFGVSTYKSIKRNQCDTAISIVHNYQLPMVLLDEITDANAQMSL